VPLGAVIEDIWRDLRVIGGDLLGPCEFDALCREIEGTGGGDFGRLYRFKTGDVMHHGPFAEYVREHLLRPQEVSAHDYLRTPELVEDIATVAGKMFDVDLLTAFSISTVPCIVAFDMPIENSSTAAAAACWYVRAAADGELTSNASGGFDGHGVVVPPNAIRSVEVVRP
jgi:hypothetical protein